MFDALFDRYERLTKGFYMDYDGQRKAEFWFTRIIILSGLIGLGIGYHYQKFSYTIYTLCIGFLIAALVTIPPWPMYRRKPLHWQRHNPKMFEGLSSNVVAPSSSFSGEKSQQPRKSARGKKSKDQ